MANLALEVINSVSDAMGNLSNRDLNWTMKVLTVYSIVLTVPTIVSGFYGENVKWLVGNDCYYPYINGVG